MTTRLASAITGKIGFTGTTQAGLVLKPLTTAQYTAATKANGDLFLDTTTNKINARINGATVQVLDSGSLSANVNTMLAAADNAAILSAIGAQAALVSGTNIKTINSSSILGSGDLVVSGSDATKLPLAGGTLTGALINSTNSAASTPTNFLSGIWFTGGSTTTTKPHLLIEPTGTTSTAWSTAGTALGVNAASGFTGNLLDIKSNNTSRMNLDAQYGVLKINFIASLNASSTIYMDTDYQWSFATFGGNRTTIETNGIRLWNSGFYSWSSSSSSSATSDLFLYRDAAGILAQRDGANSQIFHCYGTYTDASNYVRASLSASSSAITLAAETAGTGADNVDVNINATGTGMVRVNVASTNAQEWAFAGESGYELVLKSNGAYQYSFYRNTYATYLTMGAELELGGGTYLFLNGIDLILSAGKKIKTAAGSNGNLIIAPDGSGKIIMNTLPTSDPAIAGALWNSSGTLKISAG